jgi:hypothetical protein
LLEKIATIRKFRTVRTEGKREVFRKLEYYNLDMIIAVGYRVNTMRGTQFRIWANKVLKEYIIKGFVINQNAKVEQLEDLKQTVKLLSNVAKSRSDDTLLTVGFNLRLLNSVCAPQSPAGTTLRRNKVSSLRDLTKGYLPCFRRLKPTVNKGLSHAGHFFVDTKVVVNLINRNN